MLKKKRVLSILMTTQKFLLMILMKEILIKNIKHRKNYSRMHLVFVFLMPQMIHFYILQKTLLCLT